MRLKDFTAVKPKAEQHVGGRRRIRDWKGLLQDAARRIKVQVFVTLLILSASMTFMQCGFIGIGMGGHYVGYILGLLGPIAVAALLFGRRLGALYGLLSGVMLYAHSTVHPLDLFELYFVSWSNSLLLYTVAGYLLGLFFAVALRNDPKGLRRIIYMGIVCLLVSGGVSFVFLVNALVQIALHYAPVAQQGATELPTEGYNALEALVSFSGQPMFDALLMFASVLVVDIVNRWRVGLAGNVSVRTVFRAQLLVVVAIVFCVAQAASFTAITLQEENAVFERMGDELNYIGDHLTMQTSHFEKLLDIATTYAIPDEARNAILETTDINEVLKGYDLTDGTVLVLDKGVVVSSYNPAYPVGKKYEELFDVSLVGPLEGLVGCTEPCKTVYDTQPFEVTAGGGVGKLRFTSVQLGYLRALESNGVHVLMIVPSSMVFENRQGIVGWVSLVAMLLLATVYVLAARLLGKDVVEPINRTNASLARITAGNLDETVAEVESLEFASLSAGINVTVDSLKEAIAAEARRIDRDLATAKAIQESALPRVFPPFPEISEFDIFATMDAAKEVGGDFYDYFLIDDHTLGFLIADVSGKGIPGALFMMAAKTEIENHLAAGVEPVQAIASANRYLCANNDAGMFVTVWAATLDWNTGLLTYVNAGHNFPLLRRGAGGTWEWLKKRCGLFLGAFETAKYRQETLTLHAGDELLLYTDGVNEAFSLQDEEYGNDRLEAFVVSHANLSSREIVQELRTDVKRWAEGAEQSDDVTILALEYGAAPEVTDTTTVPATLEGLGQVIGLVSDELRQRHCPTDVINKVELLLEELFVNICHYAYDYCSKPGEVQVSYVYRTSPSSITVELRDQGVPFDPTKDVESVKFMDIEDLPVGGLGIHTVRDVADDFAYLRDGDTNVTVFKKRW